jgi:oligoendopeptidase F
VHVRSAAYRNEFAICDPIAADFLRLNLLGARDDMDHADDRAATPPRWRLDDLYASPAAPELAADLARAAASARRFRGQREGTLAAISPAELGRAVAEYQQIRHLAGRVKSYAHLRYAENALDPAIAGFYQNTTERVAAVERDLLFFTLELVRLDDDHAASAFADPTLARYRHWAAELRRFRPHLLSDEVEAMLMEKSVSGRLAWLRLYDQARAAWRFPVGGREYTNVEALALLRHEDGAIRREAAEAFDTVLARAAPQLTLTFSALARDKAVEDRWRGFPRPIRRRNLQNGVEDETVAALFAVVKSAYPRISQRYYRLKAGWFGRDRLDHWDRLAPLPGDQGRRYGWDEARAIVLAAWRDFSPDLAEDAAVFFDRGWIDAAPRAGKAASGFTHTVPGLHPYILVNFSGRAEDVLVLAHELGHGLHHSLADAAAGLRPEVPLTLAEMAAVFGELLTFRRMLADETDPVRRRAMLARKVEGMLHTCFRQVAYAEGAPDRRAGSGAAGRNLPGDASRISGRCREPHAGLCELVGQCRAFPARAVLSLRLSFRRMPGGCTLRPLADGTGRVCRAIHGAAGGRRRRAARSAAGAIRARPGRTGLLGDRLARDRRIYRRVGGGGGARDDRLCRSLTPDGTC